MTGVLGSVLGRQLYPLGVHHSQNISLSPDWHIPLFLAFSSVRVYVKMCWLKTIAGAWCTTHRLAEPVKLTCVFGCVEEHDTFLHYILCPSVWHICAAALGCSVPVDIADSLPHKYQY